MILLLLAVGTARAAITADRTGAFVDAAVGAGSAGGPTLALSASFGGWRGRYDDELSFGRFWGAGVGIRQDLPGDGGLRTAYLAEVRRGMDLVVVGANGWVAAGPLLVEPGSTVGTPALGVAARLGGAVELRRSSTTGIALRLEVGADAVGGGVAPAGQLTLGIQNQFAARGSGE